MEHQLQPGYLCWGVHVYFRFPGHKRRYYITLRVKFSPGIASVKSDHLLLRCWCCMAFNLDHIQSELVLASPSRQALQMGSLFTSPRVGPCASSSIFEKLLTLVLLYLREVFISRKKNVDHISALCEGAPKEQFCQEKP